jgi:hypothetical protein
MTETPRRRVSELALRCELEPLVRDLIVEGVADVQFLRRVLKDLGLEDLAVYPVDTVDVAAHLIPASESVGNRGRVISLAAELETSYPHTLSNVLCVVDKDTDPLLGVDRQTENLFTTDPADLGMYAWTPKALDPVVTEILRSPISSNDLLEMLKPHLLDVGLVRAANRKLGWGLRIISIAKDMTTASNGRIVFNREHYVQRVLATSGRLGYRGEFDEAVAALRATMPAEAYVCISSEDYAHALSWHARAVAPAFGRVRPHELLRIVLSHVRSTDLAECPLFVRIREFVMGRTDSA